MNKDISKLSPQAVWKNFYSLTQIPRPSKHEEKIRQFMVDFGHKLGLETIVDQTGNVIIRKPATPGMENRKGVILQGHLDMVPQKNSDKVHDFTTDPIEAYIDGEFVTANGTTLGADNGMGVATAMAILESKDIAHGPIEALFTTDEETGMTGAFGMKPGELKGDILLNMDSETEGELYVGCAGGTDANIKLPFKKEAVPAGHVAFKVSVKGLKGGHSGMEINLGRGNANKMMNRWLRQALKIGMRLASIDGGGLRNAIPRESFVVVTIQENLAEKLIELTAKFAAIFKNEFSPMEPDLSFTIDQAHLPASVIDAESTQKLVNAVYGCPNGIMRMSFAVPGLVETSTNLARVKSEDDHFLLQCLLRSSVDSAKESVGEMISSIFELAGAEVELTGSYPGWKPNMNSPILKTMQGVYQKLYGKVPATMAIHAGLECGLLGGVYPNWDMISFGPTICYPHSPDEKVNIASVDKFWKFLIETLKAIPVK
ncbi:MAG: aminoacyl-histidine dipeptidase [Bacteroidota bacterium]|nr:aminoacyl-histidine dipeptidase [Bacteroidota bacterium]